jgi:hypothetical protein
LLAYLQDDMIAVAALLIEWGALRHSAINA